MTTKDDNSSGSSSSSDSESDSDEQVAQVNGSAPARGGNDNTLKEPVPADNVVNALSLVDDDDCPLVIQTPQTELFEGEGKKIFQILIQIQTLREAILLLFGL